VISSIGQGKASFIGNLLNGDSTFDVMRRPGRMRESSYIGAEIDEIVFRSAISKQVQRAASLSAKAALVVLQEAWEEANLSEIDPNRVGLVVGGSNVQQREITQLQNDYRERLIFLKPSYALSFMDSDICGFCTSQFGIRGFAYTVGGASASGQLAIIHAAQAVLAGQVDVCIALGSLMDLSYWECHALRTIGAMGSDRYANDPTLACRPFDRNHDGFIFGEASGAIVVESARSSEKRKVKSYASLRGWAIAMDANRNPDPSFDGESRAILDAMQMAEWFPEQIDYINPHGTGSVIGDEIELKVLRSCGLTSAFLNATKSLIGHGLSAAGTVEVIATLLQMKAARLHPTRNLENPIDSGFNWVGQTSVSHQIENALTLSMGFGGINTAMCWQRQP